MLICIRNRFRGRHVFSVILNNMDKITFRETKRPPSKFLFSLVSNCLLAVYVAD